MRALCVFSMFMMGRVGGVHVCIGACVYTSVLGEKMGELVGWGKGGRGGCGCG